MVGKGKIAEAEVVSRVRTWGDKYWGSAAVFLCNLVASPHEGEAKGGRLTNPPCG